MCAEVVLKKIGYVIADPLQRYVLCKALFDLPHEQQPEVMVA